MVLGRAVRSRSWNPSGTVRPMRPVLALPIGLAAVALAATPAGAQDPPKELSLGLDSRGHAGRAALLARGEASP